MAAPAPAIPTRRTVALVIAEALRAAGVRYAFTVPGESFLGLLEALVDVGIRVVATRHEGAAAFNCDLPDCEVLARRAALAPAQFPKVLRYGVLDSTADRTMWRHRRFVVFRPWIACFMSRSRSRFSVPTKRHHPRYQQHNRGVLPWLVLRISSAHRGLDAAGVIALPGIGLIAMGPRAVD